MKTLMFALVLLFAGCSHKEKKKKLIADVFESYWEEHSRLFPLDATQQGDNRFNHMLPNDQTKEYRDVLLNYYTDYLNRLLKFDRDELTDNDRVSYDIFKYEMEIQIEGLKSDLWMMPFQQFWGLPLTLATLGSGESFQPFKTINDYENWLKRAEGFPAWTDSALDNFRAGMKSGVVLPKVLVLKILPQMKGIISSDPKKSVFWGPIKKFPENFSIQDKKRLTQAYTDLITKKLNPAYKKIHDFMRVEYLPRSRSTHGIGALSQGEYFYNYLARSWTTTGKTPEEIYQTGLTEVERIKSEMLKVKDQVGFKGELHDFFSSLRKNPKLMPFKKPEEVLQMFNDFYTKMEPQLLTMFNRVPKTPFEIRQTEKFREATASAEYYPGSPDGSRPGIFYLPIPDARKFNITSGTESLFLHEAIPGHHYQISLQQENELLPKFRRFAWYGAMGEGWALYTESLGKELGLYQDPYHYMGALGDEMHRACRLVVDVGIHLKKMTREEAIKYLLRNEPISEKDAVSEIERYMAIPGQALSYKVGALKIRELRQKYERELGSRFKLSNFHDEVLKDGVMPLATLEQKLEDWARRQ